MEFCVNDYVIKENDSSLYIIEELFDNNAIIKGYSIRRKFEVSLTQLHLASEEKILEEKNKLCEKVNHLIKLSKTRNSKRLLYGTILHIDGDKDYLDSCMSLYKEMNVFANGIYINEDSVKDKIEELLMQLTPDIIVITGHDIYKGENIKDLNNYVNSKNYCEALRVIRRHFDKDSVCVIVGACSSHFEALIASGANFASSPDRINIHTYDPAIIAIKVATTSCNKNIDFDEVLKFIENKRSAFGGIDTKGKMKILL